jgi:hypothetical protein
MSAGVGIEFTEYADLENIRKTVRILSVCSGTLDVTIASLVATIIYCWYRFMPWRHQLLLSSYLWLAGVDCVQNINFALVESIFSQFGFI